MRRGSPSRFESFARYAGPARIVVVTVLLALSSAYAYHVTSRGFYAQLDPGDDMSLYHEAFGFAANPYGLIDVNYYSTSALTTTHYMPMYYGYFVVLSQLFGPEALPYYLFGFILHVVNAFLLFHLVFRLTKSAAGATITFLIFMLFPGNVPTLRWVSAAINYAPLVFFMLVTLLAHMKMRETGERRFYTLAAVLYFVGCMNKQTFYPFFLVLFFFDILYYRAKVFPELSLRSVARGLFSYAPYVLLSGLFLGIQWHRYHHGWIYQFKGGALAHPIVFVRLVDHFKEFIWPFATNDPHLSYALILACFVCGLYLFTFVDNRILRLAFIWVVALGIMSMTQNLRSVAENIRYTYVMLPGFALIMSTAMSHRWARALPIAVVVVYILRSFHA